MKYDLRRYLALAALFTVATASSASWTLWPQEYDNSLSHDTKNGELFVSTSNNGVLGTFTGQYEEDLQVHSGAFIEKIEIAWTPETNITSSSFDMLMPSAVHSLGVSTVGVHIRVHLNDKYTDDDYKKVEHRVLLILLTQLPALHARIQPYPGFLAKALCNVADWDSKDLLSQFGKHTCLSSIFRFPSSDDGRLYHPSTFKLPLSHIERALNSIHIEEHFLLERYSSVVIDYTVDSVPKTNILRAYIGTSKEQLEIELPPERWTADGVSVASHVVPTIPSHLHQVIDAVNVVNGEAKKLQIQLPDSLPDTIQKAVVNVHAEGEGFHQAYKIHVKLPDSSECLDGTLLLLFPLDHSVYADLDELRRLERFGHLRLFSHQKHIEIERPSTVSTQHSIALEVDSLNTTDYHLDLPIHFRYQAPAEDKTYRQAPLFPPDFFIHCPRQNKISRRIEPIDEPYNLEWPTTVSSAQKAWRHILPEIPLHISPVPVPVGQLTSATTVSYLTFAIASLGAVILIWTSIRVTKV